MAITHSENKLQDKIAEILGLGADEVKKFVIKKRAIDSRKKKQMIFFVYTVEVDATDLQNTTDTTEIKMKKEKEEDIIKNIDERLNKIHRIEIKQPYVYEIPEVTGKLAKRPIVVGTGPCGMFSALILAKAGLKPLVIERGGDVEARIEDVGLFMDGGKLNLESNIQFGEGGAGTFSDGKLNTLITNPRIKYIFEEFVKAGAPDSILWDAKPHIGTDKIREVAKNIRKEIIKFGGEVRFNTTLTNIDIKKNKITGVTLNNKETIETDTLILAIGYSARDTYEMLFEKKLNFEQKNFAIGVRIEHKAEMINESQFDKFFKNEKLGSAKYKLVSHSDENRSVYTFCMCPGGFVMPSTAQENCVVTNGMSEYAQDGVNSNSALLVNVGREDFESDHPLAGIAFQKEWEQKAFELGGSNYNAPVQCVGDFLRYKSTKQMRSVAPTYKPDYTMTELDKCLPKFVVKSLREALPKLDQKIKGFAHPDAVMTAIETRSSAPVRITRDKETMQSNITGIYPAGEGSGYAGGIVSSAVDGMIVAEKILRNES